MKRLQKLSLPMPDMGLLSMKSKRPSIEPKKKPLKPIKSIVQVVQVEEASVDNTENNVNLDKSVTPLAK